MYRKRRAGSGKKGKLLAVLAVIVIAAVYYYVAIPAVNIHSSGFWMFLIALVVLGLLFYGISPGFAAQGGAQGELQVTPLQDEAIFVQEPAPARNAASGSACSSVRNRSISQYHARGHPEPDNISPTLDKIENV